MDDLNDSPDAVWNGFLAQLDQLPTDARVAFLLSEVFDMHLDDVAALVGMDAMRCRQLIDHARGQIQSVRQQRDERGDPS
ncbi:MAG: sigma factor-like helix-turn-helix DNA-binding protein [Luteibacter sp.]|jgi:DNA-directed RNA polymerase specialized sigma24 family protein